MKVTFHMGKAGKQMSRKHNLREFDHEKWNKDGHIQRESSGKNIVLVDEDLNKFLRKELGKAVEEFNAKQTKNPDRKKKLSDVVKDGASKARECIIQIGKAGEQLSEEKSIEFLRLAYNDFIEYNPNFKVFGAYIHCDEETPHLHLDFVPISDSKRGMSKRVSLDGALKQMGYEAGEKFADNMFIQWLTEERNALENYGREFAEEEGFTFENWEPRSKEHSTKHREYWQRHTEEAKEECQVLEAQVAELKEKTAGYQIASDYIDTLQKAEVARQDYSKEQYTIEQALKEQEVEYGSR